MLNIAIRAARSAGDVIIRHIDRLDEITVNKKGHNDFVSEIDLKAEESIIKHINKAYPDHAILAEERGEVGKGDYQWIIDPLDGTTNFLHGLPQFSISIALKIRDKLEVGVVYDPLQQELFTAVRGNGAKLNDRRIRVSKQQDLQHALLGTGFPYREGQSVDEYLRILKPLMAQSAGMRRMGSAALDLAYVAAGRFEGFWENNLKIWDIAAGVLLIQESGGLVGEPNGKSDYLNSGNIVCGNPKIYAQMLKIIESNSN